VSLTDLLRSALGTRASIIEQGQVEGTDCYRLFHGDAEGFPGLAIDRYGSLLLIQTWKIPLESGELEALNEICSEHLGIGLDPCWNHLGRPIDLERWHQPRLPTRCLAQELGLRFVVNPRHEGLEPLLALDARPVRRWMARAAPGKSVLNLFAYTCGEGIAAATHGASEVWNVDSAQSALDWGKMNATLNRMGRARLRWIEAPATPVLRQLAGLGLRIRDEKTIDFPKLDARQFGIVLLNPPRTSRSPFGTVDLARDYEHFFKPALLCVEPGGTIVVTHPTAEVDREHWIRHLIHWAESLGRSLDFQALHPEADFPSTPECPPLKMLLLQIR